METNGIKSPKGKDSWSKKGIGSTLMRKKYTGDVAIASGSSENQYLNKEHHEGIISKEQFKQFNFKWRLAAMWKF